MRLAGSSESDIASGMNSPYWWPPAAASSTSSRQRMQSRRALPTRSVWSSRVRPTWSIRRSWLPCSPGSSDPDLMTHELSWPAANLRRCGWPHSPPFRHTLHFPDGVRLTPEQAEPRASREVHESTPLDSGIQAGLSDKVVAMIIMHYLSAYGPAPSDPPRDRDHRGRRRGLRRQDQMAARRAPIPGPRR